jgi:FkbM family methyltransferase
MRHGMRKIIYDFGANNGDDIPYYLKRAELVVAVEADISLCEFMRQRFKNEIEDRRLIVENCVITVGAETEVPFYIHKKEHVLNQFPKPREKDIESFSEVMLPAATPLRLIQRHGAPYYIKIDVENYDKDILEHLFTNDIRPPFISAESHSVDVFCILVAQGHYKSFKLVEGRNVHLPINDIAIQGDDGRIERFSFPPHSAGPFGDDIKGEWLTAENCMRLLSYRGLGWKDLHATNTREPSPQKKLKYRRLLLNEALERLRDTFRKLTSSRK